ncbi:hypothetical protein PGT21_015089 [Puccinia graminis f. sp. tritici]|uniref:Uncharacterized protein n=1 Tax=Puccinia graminis f. sp. tritici TaxID=56615 RepID=A0A5B0P019_PUCGR|nr:hypothetical protein PGTUg99_020229 [Puccinia graminis f. sp. tritici]KAA1094252.1 hypothetical protein PGT21_015089 [Puccinia graminis f. sp. tritici]
MNSWCLVHFKSNLSRYLSDPVITARPTEMKKIAYLQLTSGLFFISLWNVLPGIVAPSYLSDVSEAVSSPVTWALPAVPDKGAAADLEDLRRNIQRAKEQIHNAGLDTSYQRYLDKLDSRVAMIHYLLLERYQPSLVPRHLKKQIFGEGDRRFTIGKSSEDGQGMMIAMRGSREPGAVRVVLGRGSGFQTHGQIVLSKLSRLLRSNPNILGQEIWADRKIHQFRKSVFLAIRLIIKHDLVKNHKLHPLFQDQSIARLLWRCGLIDDEIRPPRRPSAIPVLFSDPFWYQIVKGFKTKTFQEATRHELLRLYDKIVLERPGKQEEQIQATSYLHGKSRF